MSDKWDVGLVGCRTSGMSDKWFASEPINTRPTRNEGNVCNNQYLYSAPWQPKHNRILSMECNIAMQRVLTQYDIQKQYLLILLNLNIVFISFPCMETKNNPIFI